MKQIAALFCFLFPVFVWSGFMPQIDARSCEEFAPILEENFKFMESALDNHEFKREILKEHFTDNKGFSSQSLYDLIQAHRNSNNFKFKVYCYDPRIQKSITRLDIQDISDIHEKQMSAFVLRGTRKLYINLYPIMEYLYDLESIRIESPEKHTYAANHQYLLASTLLHEILHMPGFDFDHPYSKDYQTAFFSEPYYHTVPVKMGVLLRVFLAKKDKHRAFSIWIKAKNK